MGLVHGGMLVAKILKREGVEVVFTLSGGHIAGIYDGCIREGIRVVDTRHEQAAVHAAEGWTKSTRKPGVALLTAGPGDTDGVTGVANAYLAGSPILVMGGAAPLSLWDRGALQEMNQIDLLRPITKWARTAPDPDMVVKAAALLEKAQRPVVMASTAVWWCDAAEPLRQLAERINAPVFLNGAGRGCLPPTHPLFFTASRRKALEGADTILAIGIRMDFRLNHGQPPLIPAEAHMIWFDLLGEDVGVNRGAAVGLVGDVGVSMHELAEATK